MLTVTASPGSYTVTVGAGGLGSLASNQTRGFNGSDSTFAHPGGNITGTGGGGGSGRTDDDGQPYGFSSDHTMA